MPVSLSNTVDPVQSNASDIAFCTNDGVELAGIRYKAVGTPIGDIVLAGATGVPQGFYQRFASYAAEQGFNVLTFDYRGIGQSKSGSLRQLEMSFLDWGRYDISAAIDVMYEPGSPLFLVGHSYGGQAVGLLPNHQKLTAVYCFGSGAGWAGWMPRIEAIKVRVLWTVVLPLLVKWKGYMAWSKLGMGEDLPLGVYRDWKRWCRYPRYFFDDKDLHFLKERYAQLSLPFIAATSTDDLWAPPKSRDSFCQHYSGCNLEFKNIEPKHNQRIGHIGYFRESCNDLWPEVLAWFESVKPTHLPNN